MAIFKCKMCGGTLEIKDGSTIAECTFCGTKQTIPRLDDERRANLYDRANHFRRNNDYDKAMAIYEQILQDEKTDAEAYWSLVLCKYGIEYVEDYKTHKWLPTINRIQYTSIFADEDYKSAIEYADGYQRDIYEMNAKEIDELQKQMLAISQQEKPFDIFICYKETDSNGRRTQDSVLAQDLYYQLTNEGYKVFFSRITLEDKLGTAYEPYIFAALNSAKVMVVLGTKPENFTSIWVKNEWSRFLALIKKDHTKVLIPAYRDMDPYDLPEEFSHLQAQDMSKLGFMQDLIRGIKKIANVTAPKSIEKETVVVRDDVNIAPILKRAYLFLEDNDWELADEYAEKALDQDPENADAYLVKLMIDLRVSKKSELENVKEPFEDNKYYKKALRFADNKLAETLQCYNITIKERKKQNDLLQKYNNAVGAMNRASKEAEFENAAKSFDGLSGFRDADSLAEQCREKAKICKKNEIYSAGRSYMQQNLIGGYSSAIKKFQMIPGWKDADELADICSRRIEELKIKAEKERLAKIKREEEAKIEEEKRQQERKKRNKKIGVVTIILLCIGAILTTTLCILLPLPTERVDGIEYVKTSDGYELRTAQSNLNGDFEIPEEIKGVKVTSIGGSAFYGCNRLTSITIPDSVTSIGDYAFRGCSGLKNVTIGNSVTSIGGNAFYNCSGLTSVTIGNSVTSIGGNAFYNCSGLTSVTIGNSVTSIDGYAFAYCSGLTSVTIGNGVTSIGDYAFYYCSGLTSITIPDSVTSIGEYAFYGCSGLTTVNWNAINCTVAGTENYYIFKNCAQLVSINIAENVQTIPSYAFKECSKLTSIIIPPSVTNIGNNAFGCCSSLESMTLPATGFFGGLFGSSNFEGSVLIKQYDGIGTFSFYIPSKLKTITINGGNISNGTFSGCSELTNITILDGVTSIGWRAFADCSSLTTVTIPASIISINGSAFSGCSNLNAVNITDIAKWCKISFEDAASNPLSVAHNLYVNGELLTNLETQEALFDIKQYAFYGCSITSLTLNGNSVIRENAFRNCNELTSITINDGVKTIMDYAFYGCAKITEVVIPESVEKIGCRAFNGCNSLSSIVFEDDTTWYYVSYKVDWQNKENGYEENVSDASTNVSNFQSTYEGYYWYKL